MEQFSLEKYLENPTRKVVTRNGKTVRIVCWDKLGEYPIIGCVKYSDDYEDLESYDINGFKYSFDREDQNDLFFADEEPESIEIPFGAKDSEFVRDEYYIPEGCEARIEGNKVIIERVQKENELTKFEKAVQNILNEPHFQDVEAVKQFSKTLLDLARKEILKDFPKWKKATEYKEFEVHVCVMDENTYTYLDTTVIEGEYYIELSDLKTLPKEE